MLREAVSDNGAISSSRLFIAVWLMGMLLAYFVVLTLIAVSPVIEMTASQAGVLTHESVFRWEWDRFGAGFNWGAVTFGGLVVNYLGNRVTGAIVMANGGAK